MSLGSSQSLLSESAVLPLRALPVADLLILEFICLLTYLGCK